MARHQFRKRSDLPPLLKRVIEAASASDRIPQANALREFGIHAVTAVLTHGVFAPNDEHTTIVVERAAKEHFGMRIAQNAFREAIRTVEPFAARDEIASACNHVRSISEEAYFYAGLAFGITLADLIRR